MPTRKPSTAPTTRAAGSAIQKGAPSSTVRMPEAKAPAAISPAWPAEHPEQGEDRTHLAQGGAHVLEGQPLQRRDGEAGRQHARKAVEPADQRDGKRLEPDPPDLRVQPHLARIEDADQPRREG